MLTFTLSLTFFGLMSISQLTENKSSTLLITVGRGVAQDFVHGAPFPESDGISYMQMSPWTLGEKNSVLSPSGRATSS